MILDGGHVEDTQGPVVDETQRTGDRLIVDVSRIQGDFASVCHLWNKDCLKHFHRNSKSLRCHLDVVIENDWARANLQVRWHQVVGYRLHHHRRYSAIGQDQPRLLQDRDESTVSFGSERDGESESGTTHCCHSRFHVASSSRVFVDDDLIEESHRGVADNGGDTTGVVDVSSGHRVGYELKSSDEGLVMGVRKRVEWHADGT